MICPHCGKETEPDQAELDLGLDEPEIVIRCQKGESWSPSKAFLGKLNSAYPDIDTRQVMLNIRDQITAGRKPYKKRSMTRVVRTWCTNARSWNQCQKPIAKTEEGGGYEW